MKKLLSLGVLSLFFVMPTLSGSAQSGSQDHDLDQGILDRFIGAFLGKTTARRILDILIKEIPR